MDEIAQGKCVRSEEGGSGHNPENYHHLKGKCKHIVSQAERNLEPSYKVDQVYHWLPESPFSNLCHPHEHIIMSFLPCL